MATSTTMRRGFVKVKRMPPATRPAPQLEDEEFVGEKAKPARPFLAMRSISRVPSKPWWSNWQTLLLLLSFLFFIVSGAYLLGKADKSRLERQKVTTTDHSAPRRGSAGFAPGKGNAGDTTWGSIADYSAPTAESFVATYGGSAGNPPAVSPSPQKAQAPRETMPKLVLDRNISGNCTIGMGQIEDFYACLERASAKSANNQAKP